MSACHRNALQLAGEHHQRPNEAAMHRQMVHLLPARVSNVQHRRRLAAAQHQSHGEALAMSAAHGGTCHVCLWPCIIVLASLVLHMQ